jgi:DNA-binding transcriptional MerR regulator
MSMYTTGEIAKLCGVSVRTVQYYDTRNILVPSQLSEGGRRLYSEEDLGRMRVICFLRDLGVSINGISALFADEHPEQIISLLLDEQERELTEQIEESRKKLEAVAFVKRTMREFDGFSVDSIGDIAHLMKHRHKLAKLRWTMVLTGIPVTALQWTSIILWITTGLWWLFVLWACVAILWGIAVSVCYVRSVSYICPECHEVFAPRMREFFWAYHTPKMRRLTCPQCSFTGLCVEIYTGKEKKSNG